MAGVGGVIGRPERHRIPRITLHRADRFAKPDTAPRGKGRMREKEAAFQVAGSGVC